MNLKLLIESESFSQNFPLELKEFIKYCNDRDILINEKILEFLEEKKLFFPIFRTEQWTMHDTKMLKKLYSTDLLKEPRNEEFIPWEEFYKLNEKFKIKELSINSYYSKYQLFYLKRILNFITLKFTFNQLDEDKEIFTKNKKFREDNIDLLLNSNNSDLIFLLNYGQNKYLPLVKDSRYTVLTNIDIEELNQLNSLIDLSNIFKETPYSIDDLKNIRVRFAVDGLSIDPLENWYHLIKYVSHEKRANLKGKALLAIDYYAISDMLKLLIEDLTGEEQLETASILDSPRSSWQIRIYGKKINHKDIDVLQRLLTEYGINPNPDLFFIVEGYSEEAVIPIILNSYGFSLEEYRIELYNVKGVDKKIDELIKYKGTPITRKINDKYYISPYGTKIFGLFDREGRFAHKEPEEIIDKIMKNIFETLPTELKTKKISDVLENEIFIIKFWDKCFEYDNLSNKELILLLKEYGMKYGHEFEISDNEMNVYRNRNENIERLFRSKTGADLSKKEFGKLIGNYIVENIRNGKEDYPIINVMNEVIYFSKGASLE